MAFVPVLHSELLPIIDYGVTFVTAVKHGSRVYAASRTGIYRLSEDAQTAELVFSFGTTFSYHCALNSTGQVLFLTGGSSTTETSVYRSFDGTSWEIWKAHDGTHRWRISGAGDGGYVLDDVTNSGTVRTLGAVDGSTILVGFDPYGTTSHQLYHPQALLLNPLGTNRLWAARTTVLSVASDLSVSSANVGIFGSLFSLMKGSEGLFVHAIQEVDGATISYLSRSTDGATWETLSSEFAGRLATGSAIYTKFGILATISEASIDYGVGYSYTFLQSESVTSFASGQAGYSNPNQVCAQFVLPLSETEFLFVGKLNHNTSPASGQILRLYAEPPVTPEFWTAFVNTYEIR